MERERRIVTILFCDVKGSTSAAESMDPEEWGDIGLPEGGSILDPDRSVRARSMAGGPSPASVLAQATAIEESLATRNSGVSKT